MSHYGRWYSTTHSAKPRGVVQFGQQERDAAYRGERYTLPEGILRLAQTEYEHQYGNKQDYERMQERSGLSVMEVIGLLADYVERLGGKPTTPRSTS